MLLTPEIVKTLIIYILLQGMLLQVNVIPGARVRNTIFKGPKYRFPSNIYFPKCRRESAASLNKFSNRWCKRENVEPDALMKWKINFFLNY